MKWLWAPLQSNSRNPYVDALRGFSILVVLFAHFSALCGPFTAPRFTAVEFVRALGRNSCFGVTIFFVVSGFLITTSSIQRFGSLGRLNLRHFCVYRASRILPLLVLLTGFNLTCTWLGASDFALNADVPMGRLLAYLFTFRFNLLYLNGAAVLPAWAVLWSLAVEEVFYLGYPLLCRVLRRTWFIVIALTGFAAYGPFVRHHLGWSGIYDYWGCFDQLALGCLAGLAADRWRRTSWFARVAPALLVVGAMVTLGFYFARDAHLNEYFIPAPTVIGIGAAIFLFGAANWTPPVNAAPWWRQARTLRLLGFLSYELYLFHMPLYLFLKPVTAAVKAQLGGGLPRDLAFLVLIPLLLIFGSLLARAIGFPLQRQFRRLVDRTPRAQPVPRQAGAADTPP